MELNKITSEKTCLLFIFGHKANNCINVVLVFDASFIWSDLDTQDEHARMRSFLNWLQLCMCMQCVTKHNNYASHISSTSRIICLSSEL